LKYKTRNDIKIKFYEVMAAPTLSCGSENWVTKQKDISKIQADEMKFLRKVK